MGWQTSEERGEEVQTGTEAVGSGPMEGQDQAERWRAWGWRTWEGGEEVQTGTQAVGSGPMEGQDQAERWRAWGWWTREEEEGGIAAIEEEVQTGTEAMDSGPVDGEEERGSRAATEEEAVGGGAAEGQDQAQDEVAEALIDDD